MAGGFTVDVDDQVVARLRAEAALLGLLAPVGRHAGKGSVSALLRAIAGGDVRLVRRPPTAEEAARLHPDELRARFTELGLVGRWLVGAAEGAAAKLGLPAEPRPD